MPTMRAAMQARPASRPLTDLEHRVLRAVAHGMDVPHIAVHEGLTEAEAAWQLRRARTALGAKNSAQAVYRALKMGLID